MISPRHLIWGRLIGNKSANLCALRKTALRLDSLEDRSVPSAGALDQTFGADGTLAMPIGVGNDVGQTVAVAKDGKFVVGATTVNAGNSDFALIRYFADGSLDSSFGNDGKVITDITANDTTRSIAIQADGKIVLVGNASN